MYLKPGNLFKDFIIENIKTTITSRGRKKSEYCDNVEKLSAVLAESTPEEKERYHQLGHTISHTLTQRGKPKVKEEDKLILDDRLYLVKGVDEPGNLGLWTIYYVVERNDLFEN